MASYRESAPHAIGTLCDVIRGLDTDNRIADSLLSEISHKIMDQFKNYKIEMENAISAQTKKSAELELANSALNSALATEIAKNRAASHA